MERVCASDPGRHRHHHNRPARRLRADSGGLSRRGARPRIRHVRDFVVVGAARPADQSARERSAAGAAALRDHGPAARPAAGGRRSLSHQQRDPPEQGIGAAGFRHVARRPARSDERIGRRQRAGLVTRGVAAAHRRRRAGGNPRRHRCRRLDARRAGAALAGAHPAQRRDAQRAHLCGHRHRPQRPRHQYGRRLSRGLGPGRDFPAAVHGASPGLPAAATRLRRPAKR